MKIKYLSYRKLKLLTLLWLSYHLSYYSKKEFRWGKAVALSIEPTNSCNLSCIECPTGTNGLTRSIGLFSTNALQQLLNEKAKDLIYLNFYFQGEPFINKDITKMVKMASEKKIYTSLSTNAQLINKETALDVVNSGLNRIIISIDGTTQEVYETYRKGGKLELVINATKYLIEAKRELSNQNLKIIFQFLVFKHNEHQIHEIRQLGKQIGVDKVEIKTAQIYNYQNNTESIPTINKHSRYQKDKNGEYQIKNPMHHKCWRMWHSAVVTQDLNVVPCCFDKDAEFSLGNLNNKSFNEIDLSIEQKKFRQKISNGRSNILMCQNCTEGLKSS